MSAAGAEKKTAQTTPSQSDRMQEDLERMRQGPKIHLLQAEPPLAREHIRRLAASLGCIAINETAWNLQSTNDGSEAIRNALRAAIVFERRRIDRVLAGRIVSLEPLAATSDTGPPSKIQVHLETHEDARTIHLEGPWAWHLHAQQARIGDIIQIDRKHPLISVHDDPDVLDGRVLDERDHRVQIPLNAIDLIQAETQPVPTQEDEDPEEQMLGLAARTHATLLGTGERPPTGPQARARTDAWVRRRLGEKHTRLVLGVLLVQDATGIPDKSRSAIRAALHAPTCPWIILQAATEEAYARLEESWPEARPLPPLRTE
jgi:DNA helicase TIP49 (TBP-interacting protein)